MNQDRLYSLDMMKFVAAIFITNSHFQPLYGGGEYCLCYFRGAGQLCLLRISGIVCSH